MDPTLQLFFDYSHARPTLRSVVFRDQHTTWTISAPALPQRLVNETLYIDENQAMYIETMPLSEFSALPSISGVVFTPQNVILASQSGVLIVNRADGKIIHDYSNPYRDGGLFFDDATITVTYRKSAQESSSVTGHGRRGHFVIHHENSIVHFNGVRLVVLEGNGDWKVLRQVDYEPEAHFNQGANPSQVQAVFTLPPYVIEVKGIVYL
eukprot:TRINITY_DN1247_c0_g1_i2.p1 TRINITY_DN1247_c0_g1~~TRINITY_DN1247_c0_g1_i2.p1  ORF type:complete len:209 (+),score=35.42 TRINITY_DN1247_c0_g1_i2:64-690(+)